MIKYITVILTILISFGISSLAEPFKVPPIMPNEKGTIVTEYKDGGLRWKADWKTEVYVENGETKFKLVLNAKGVTSPFSLKMTWRSVSIWKAEDEFIPLESDTIIKNLSGYVVMIDKKKPISFITGTFCCEAAESDGAAPAHLNY